MYVINSNRYYVTTFFCILLFGYASRRTMLLALNFLTIPQLPSIYCELILYNLGIFLLSDINSKSYSLEENKRANDAYARLPNVTGCENLIKCGMWCTEDPSCTAANYDDDTSQCELLTSPTVWLTQQHGFIALISQVTGKCLTEHQNVTVKNIQTAFVETPTLFFKIYSISLNLFCSALATPSTVRCIV